MSEQAQAVPEVRHYRRVGLEDCHYNGNMMSGAKIIEMVTDASGELSIRTDGDGGLLVAIENASITQSVFAGESLEIIVRLVKVGNRSRRKAFEVYKHIRKRPDISRGAAEVLNPPVLVAKGTLVSVVGQPKRPEGA